MNDNKSNREIKFKALTLSGDWVVGEPHINCRMPHIHMDAFNYRPIKADTLCQFTGLYDKEGKEIYEGDILSCYIDELDSDYHVDGDFLNDIKKRQVKRQITEVHGVVVYKNGSFALETYNKMHEFDLYCVCGEFFGIDEDSFNELTNRDLFPEIQREDMWCCKVIGNIFNDN